MKVVGTHGFLWKSHGNPQESADHALRSAIIDYLYINDSPGFIPVYASLLISDLLNPVTMTAVFAFIEGQARCLNSGSYLSQLSPGLCVRLQLFCPSPISATPFSLINIQTCSSISSHSYKSLLSSHRHLQLLCHFYASFCKQNCSRVVYITQ